MKWSIVIIGLLAIVTVMVPLSLYALVYYGYLTLSLGISDWIEIWVGVIFMQSIWVGPLLFLSKDMEKRVERKETNF
jgi:hypothetical protein